MEMPVCIAGIGFLDKDRMILVTEELCKSITIILNSSIYYIDIRRGELQYALMYRILHDYKFAYSLPKIHMHNTLILRL